MALDDGRKKSLASMEMGAFFNQTAQVKAFVRVQGNYNGNSYTIFKDSNDGDADAKAAAVHNAVKAIVDKGVALPTGLRVYCTKAYEAQNRAFSRGMGWDQVAYVILGPAALVGGRTDALSATGLAGKDKPTITCIHEIGHILHERSMGDAFWETGSGLSGKATNGSEVSGYAGQNKKEFVAEVFASLILGKKYSDTCMREYAALHGPAVP
jgi:hypothetical protein